MDRGMRWNGRRWAAAAAVAAVAGCGGDDSPTDLRGPELECSIPENRIFTGQVRDGIPALTDPLQVGPDAAGTTYLSPDDRVIGLKSGDSFLAIPLNIMWYHEIVNLRFGGLDLAVTHCPLTGSSLAFDRAGAGGAEFGVSGLLYQNNLIMYDRSSAQSLWPQMIRGARCGSLDGTSLTMVPIVEMTWQGWRTLHPDTRVLSSDTGRERDYHVYPYGDYDRTDNPQLLFPQGDVDGRRPPKERVLGIPDGAGGGVAYPFGELQARGWVAAVHHGGRVILWDGNREGAMAFQRVMDGSPLTFEVRDDTVFDLETGTAWSVDGVAVDGPLAGRRLTPVPDAYVAFWFAWAAFQPDAELWRAS